MLGLLQNFLRPFSSFLHLPKSTTMIHFFRERKFHEKLFSIE